MYQEDWEKKLDSGRDDWMDSSDWMEVQLDQIRDLIGEPEEAVREKPVAPEFSAEQAGAPAPAPEPDWELTDSWLREEQPEVSLQSEEDLFTQSLYELLDGPGKGPDRGVPRFRDPGVQAYADDPPAVKPPAAGKKPASKKEKPAGNRPSRKKHQTQTSSTRKPVPEKPAGAVRQGNSGGRASGCLIALVILELILIGAVAVCWYLIWKH